jgi:hypothetical protein
MAAGVPPVVKRTIIPPFAFADQVAPSFHVIKAILGKPSGETKPDTAPELRAGGIRWHWDTFGSFFRILHVCLCALRWVSGAGRKTPVLISHCAV